jgi:S-adenosylmethionine:tRNA-ribosyltransferase-isomerase (queuine synthetase)
MEAERNVQFRNTLLHIGAGTFIPVEGDVTDHTMHQEPFSISTALVRI